jgi:hypothetical protein
LCFHASDDHLAAVVGPRMLTPAADGGSRRMPESFLRIPLSIKKFYF